MAAQNCLTVERLRELLDYDPVTGIFRWKQDRMSGQYRKRCVARAGDVAGCRTVKGYWQIVVERRIYRAHRLAWFYVKGEWPQGPLDHKDGGTLENKIENLRPCNGRQNNANRASLPKNASGFKGVYKNGKWSTWVARIGGYGNREFLGCYADPDAAARAYDEAAVRIFGEFARTNKMLGLL